MNAFSGFDLIHNARYDLDRAFPSYLTTFQNSVVYIDDPASTSFIYVHTGPVQITLTDGRQYILARGMVASIPGNFTLALGSGIIVTRENWRGYFNISGPVEQEGRLKYIDGCTDSLLIAPPKKGDPCLNLLYFPSGIDQTEHTHPSDRIGMVMSGRGRCVHRPAPDAEPILTDLRPGMAFCIHTDGLHKFQTPYGEPMRVLAYHPDSDHGPSDEEHPMLNRTIVDGVSARHLDDIRTK